MVPIVAKESSPTQSAPLHCQGARKDGVRKVTKFRQPRRLIDYSEPESADDDSKESSRRPESSEVWI